MVPKLACMVSIPGNRDASDAEHPVRTQNCLGLVYLFRGEIKKGEKEDSSGEKVNHGMAKGDSLSLVYLKFAKRQVCHRIK